MIDTLLNVVYVLIAIGMIVLILLQRGAGAQAGSGFGAGASGTVFGSRGSANFLSSSTKYLAALFFGLSLFMAWQASHRARGPQTDSTDLGVMAELPPAAATPAPGGTVLAPAPAATAPATSVPAPAAPQGTTPVITPAAPQSATQPEPSGTQPEVQAPVEDSKGG